MIQELNEQVVIEEEKEQNEMIEELLELEAIEEQTGVAEVAKADIEDDEEETQEELDLSQLVFATSRSQAIGKTEPGVLSIINTEKNGKRLLFSKDLMGMLNESDHVQIAFTEHEMVIGRNLDKGKPEFQLRKQGAKKVIYAAGLVQEITEWFDLDFDHRVCLTFSNVRYLKNNDQIVALITMK